MHIQSFRGYRFDPAKVGELSRVVAPPYDQIDEAVQARLYAMSPYNVVRITMGREEPGDNGERNRYRRAREYFDRWLQDGVLVRDPEPAIYLYHQVYRIGGQDVTRRGFIALGELTDYSQRIVLPHEQTHAKAKEDRFKLLEATRGDFGLVFMLYSDPADAIGALVERVAGGRPTAEVRDQKGVLHQIWRLTERELIGQVETLMRGKPVIIADGHHRYETALEFSRAHPEGRWKLMAFFALESPGVTIFPNHRLVRDLTDFRAEGFLRRVGEWFEVEELPAPAPGDSPERETQILTDRLSRAEEDGRRAFGFVASSIPRNAILTLRTGAFDRIPWPADTPASWRRLAVSLLHEGILRPLLGITEEKLRMKAHVDYTADAEEAVRLTRDGKYQAAFLLTPTTPAELRAVVETGHVLPQKSTHFYPKLLTGMVIAKVGEE